MMRSRVSGCLCLDCSGGWIKDRAEEKREWQREVATELEEIEHKPAEVYEYSPGTIQSHVACDPP